MLVQKDLVEISHISIENSELFGATVAQCQYISELIYKCPMKVQCYVLDKLYSISGFQNIRYHLTRLEATKLINAMETGIEFQFIEWNSPEWHEIKLKEKRFGLHHKPNISFDYNNDMQILNNEEED
jgi:hypothetical protein